MTRDELLRTKEDLLTTKEDLKANDVSILKLEREVSFLKDPPWSFACGAHSESNNIASQVISYTTLLYSSTNVPGVGLDISTGVFTSGHPGSYTATWSLTALDGAASAGHPVSLYLRKNGVNIDESLHKSRTENGGVWDQGGRTLVLHLDRGDTLDLYCKDCSDVINHTT